MQVSATDAYRVYRPSNCELRLYLHHHGIEAAGPGPFEEVIRSLGERHERRHLATFPDVLDLRTGTTRQRHDATLEAIRQHAPVLYQSLFWVTARLGERECEIVGSPDLLLLQENGTYVIRDVKIARRINHHPEIIWQLRIYGWLYERAVGKPAARLEIYNGAGEIVAVEPVASNELECELSRYVQVIEATEAPFAPVGWTKCGNCGYHERCWTAAEDAHDVALVPKVDQGLVFALRETGVVTYEDLLARFNENELAALRRGHGKRTSKVGKAAATILRSAEALAYGRAIVIQSPVIPRSPNYAMFDLEGLPPQLDELEKIYLWGIQVYGAAPSEYLGATAAFDPDGDRDGWASFLSNARWVLQHFGDIPFVHWHHYERMKLDLYVQRYGDRDGIASRVRANLFDLLPATQKAVALPLSSYSLKAVERYIGFGRSQTEYGGDWAMARYIEAIETSDEKLQQKLLSDIMTYNREDLAATWAVLCWLRDLGRRVCEG